MTPAVALRAIEQEIGQRRQIGDVRRGDGGGDSLVDPRVGTIGQQSKNGGLGAGQSMDFYRLGRRWTNRGGRLA